MTIGFSKLNIAIIVVAAILSGLFAGIVPGLAGVLGGIAVSLFAACIIELKCADLTVGELAAKSKVLRTGIWSTIPFAASAGLLLYGLVTTSYIFSFLGTIVFWASFTLMSSAAVARNSEADTKE